MNHTCWFETRRQMQALLLAIGGIDPMDSNFLVFNHAGYTPQLSAQLAFLIQVKALNKNVHRTIIDEGGIYLHYVNELLENTWFTAVVTITKNVKSFQWTHIYALWDFE